MKQNANQLNISENELLEYINGLVEVTPERPQGFGITATEYARAHGMGHNKARLLLDNLVKDGKLKSQEMRDRGHKGRVYHK